MDRRFVQYTGKLGIKVAALGTRARNTYENGSNRHFGATGARRGGSNCAGLEDESHASFGTDDL